MESTVCRPAGHNKFFNVNVKVYMWRFSAKVAMVIATF
jgi:hypothetical protein